MEPEEEVEVLALREALAVDHDVVVHNLQKMPCIKWR
jgi:hypothetical protein